MRKLGLVLGVLGTFFLVAGVSPVSAQTMNQVVFDSLSLTPGFTDRPFLGITAPTPHSFMGQAFSAADPGIAGPLHITGMDFIVGTRQNVDFTNVFANVQFWNTYTGVSEDVNPTGVAFADAATASPVSVSIGALALTPPPPEPDGTQKAVYVIEHISFISAATPDGIALFNQVTGYANLGLTISFSGTDINGAQAVDTLSAGVRNSELSPFTVGYVPAMRDSAHANNTEYFRNADGRTDYNFIGSDGRDLADTPAHEMESQFYSALGIRLYAEGTLPEPSTLPLLAVGAMSGGGLLWRRRRNALRQIA